MNANLQIKTISDGKYPQNDRQEFMRDVERGLSSKKKYISSKYFYDEKGSELFNQITRHPDYYLTKCELEILEDNKREFADIFGESSFNLIELGPGEGIKSRIFINEFLQRSLDFTYFTIDISRRYLNQIVKQFNHDLPKLKLIALNSDYFSGLHWLSQRSKRRNVVLFLGSSIGNFNQDDTQVFLKNIASDLQNDDYLLIGFDLRKDINILNKAYNDSDLITRHFNLNLLNRMNRELGGHFDLDQFQHYATYNVYSGAMESYLLSRKKQSIPVDALNRSFSFYEYEPIHVEYSYKYLIDQLEIFAENSGFEIVKNYMDSKGYFVDSLWRVRK
ncbi:Histidine-specific methyltransferase EgtD [Legionella quinlivanii]|uniref:Histidine-specific methyltransferase EgtD n=1 Tax=Legionella quinlivanii TaxID=45073 RepID=A0A0W0Y6Q4_9GAMM|nr:L-histidine N(alpha)-methyltransferase [Legionella quinlivanii]KTD52351.1 Histidine-specific methyltransferase EgtD [Legionella quinlivanii]MCW8449699.1 L-histidine N(alpha)-methyltransferase [Legionella quinlivanii]SEF71796.1 dimethylhistidine N-methyltransferase [Legionella quinlivanii DSM 21216]STY12150.1 Histidine-specific methyltransferase EgtD [Legionella quinlivanii]